MCWRDEEEEPRCCLKCGQDYYGSLGHKDCPGWTKDKKEPVKRRRERVPKKPF